ncbi:hypothetical protein ACFO5K_01270 [Nocardia halotolerans]|uniref:Polyketide cyclase / dehydrase and lipid transport n=1 Tax=Nocardia halotolerans TaxID=1755878 RepID=A0ABV8V9Z5_9NOCA
MAPSVISFRVRRPRDWHRAPSAGWGGSATAWELESTPTGTTLTVVRFDAHPGRFATGAQPREDTRELVEALARYRSTAS